MMKQDYLLRVIDRQKQFRMVIANTTGVVEEARLRHNTSATASAALGRVLTAALMLATDLKNPGNILSIRVDGSGISGVLLATADAMGNVRGYIANPSADLPSLYPGKLNVGGIVGKNGYLEITRDIGLKQPFSGKASLVSGEIAEDVANYLLVSEQVPSLVSLGVLVDVDLHVKVAGGLLIQALPGADHEYLSVLEKQALKLGQLSAVLDSCEFLEEIVAMVLNGIAYDIIEKRPLAFKCTCNRERLAAILAGLGEEELEGVFESGKMEVICNFCNQKYYFSPQDIAAEKSNKP